MSEYRYKVRGRDGTIVAYTSTLAEARQVVREDGEGEIERHFSRSNPARQGDDEAMRYVRDKAAELEDRGMDPGAAMGTAWSIGCRSKREEIPSFEDHCRRPADQYLRRNPWEPADKAVDLRTLEGPFVVTSGTVKGVDLRGIRLYFSPKRNAYYSPDIGGWLDVGVPPRPEPKPSARTREKLALLKEQTSAQQTINTFKRVEDQQGYLPPADKREVQTLKKRVEEIEGRLKVIAPPPKDFEPPPKVEVAMPKSPKGQLLLRFDWDKQTGLIRCFFDNNSPLAPIARSTLMPYCTTPLARGDLGYWAFHEDDLASVIKDVERNDVLVFEGLPTDPTSVFMQLKKALSQIDAAAKKAKKIKLEHTPKFAPIVGTVKGKKLPYQDDGIRFLMSRKRALLADDMGLGKTYQAIVAAQTIVPKNQQILIVSPAAVVGNWKDDIGKFEDGVPAVILTESERVGGEGEDPSVVYPGNYAAAIDGLPPKDRARFVVVSYDAVANRRASSDVRQYGLDTEWGCVIVDEAHRAKKPESLANQFLMRVKTERLWLLTGTPIANRPIDMFGLLQLLQHPLGDNKGRFAAEFTVKRVGAASGGFEGVATNLDQLRKLGELVSGTVLRRTKDEVLKERLPTKHGGLLSDYGKVDVTIPEGLADGQLSDLPDKLNAGTISTLRTQLAKAKVPFTWDVAQKVLSAGEKVVIFTGFTEAMREFEQLCEQDKHLYVKVDGAVSLTEKNIAAKLFQRAALSPDDRASAERIYGSWFLKLLDRTPYKDWTKDELAEATKRYGKDREDWPHTVSVFLGQIMAASEGITLTAADVLIFNDLDWMPTKHQQAEDRIYRLASGGQSHKDVYISYVMANSWLDDMLYAQLVEKAEEIGDVYRGVSPDPDKVSQKVRKDFEKDLQRAMEIASLTQSKDPKLAALVQKDREAIAKLRAKGLNAAADRKERLLESTLRLRTKGQKMKAQRRSAGAKKAAATRRKRGL